MAVSKNTKGKSPPRVKDPSGIIKDPERKQPGSRRSFYSKHDWDEIESCYVYGDMSMTELAKAYGCNQNTLRGQARKKEWAKKRERARHERRMRVNETLLDRQAADGAKVIQNIQKATERIANMAAQIMADELQFRRHLIQTQKKGVTDTEERVYNKADARAFRDILIGLKELTNVTRDAFGMPKADAAKADAEATTGVILLPEREDAGATAQAQDQAWEFLKGEEYGSSGGAGPGAGPGADAAEAPATGEPDAEGQGGGA